MSHKMVLIRLFYPCGLFYSTIIYTTSCIGSIATALYIRYPHPVYIFILVILCASLVKPFCDNGLILEFIFIPKPLEKISFLWFRTFTREGQIYRRKRQTTIKAKKIMSLNCFKILCVSKMWKGFLVSMFNCYFSDKSSYCHLDMGHMNFSKKVHNFIILKFSWTLIIYMVRDIGIRKHLIITCT